MKSWTVTFRYTTNLDIWTFQNTVCYTVYYSLFVCFGCFLNNKIRLTWRTHPSIFPSFYHLVSATSLFSIFSWNTVKEIFKNLPSKAWFSWLSNRLYLCLTEGRKCVYTHTFRICWPISVKFHVEAAVNFTKIAAVNGMPDWRKQIKFCS